MDTQTVATTVVSALAGIGALGGWLSQRGSRQRRDYERSLVNIGRLMGREEMWQDREGRWRRQRRATERWADQHGHDDLPALDPDLAAWPDPMELQTGDD